MGFWRNVASAVDNVTSYMNEVAERANQASARLLVENKIARMEERLDRDVFTSDIERRQSMLELLVNYDALLTHDGKAVPPSLASKKAALQARLRDMDIADLGTLIKHMEDRIAATEYSLPIDKICDMRDLIKRYRQLALIANSETGEKLARREAEVLKKIEELELRRREVVSQRYPSGAMLSTTSCFDRKRSGPATYWYESGNIRVKAKYLNDLLDGDIEHLYPTGELSFKGYYASGKPSSTVRCYCRKGQKVIQIKSRHGIYHLRLWLWNGRRLGALRFSKGKFRGKLPLLLKGLLNPFVLGAFYRIARGKDDAQAFEDWQSFSSAFRIPLGDSLDFLVE